MRLGLPSLPCVCETVERQRGVQSEPLPVFMSAKVAFLVYCTVSDARVYMYML